MKKIQNNSNDRINNKQTKERTKLEYQEESFKIKMNKLGNKINM